MVATFEVRSDGLRRLGEAPTLTEASAALPAGGYTTLRTYGGHRLLRLWQHVRRLEESAQAPLDQERVRTAVAAALRATANPESRLRVTYASPRLFVSVEPFEPPAEALYRDGVACATVPLHRDRPHAKDTRFIAAAAGAYERLPPGAYEGLMVGGDGAILEGLSSNFFAVHGRRLRTEEERALLGVTRSLVLELAREVVPVSTVAVRMGEVSEIEEAFITSVSRGIVPVVSIDGAMIAVGHPGPVTRELSRRFRDLVEREAASAFAEKDRKEP